MKTLALVVVVLALLGGSPSQGGELSAPQIKAARKLYVNKCAKCHKLHDPTDYSDEEWSKWMEKMSRKSRLKPAQADLLAKYIAAGRAGKIKLPK